MAPTAATISDLLTVTDDYLTSKIVIWCETDTLTKYKVSVDAH